MQTRRRIGVALLIFTLIIGGLIGRLAWLQLIKGPELTRRALAQWMREIPVEPKRGIIFDRNGNELAISASADTVVALPAQIPKEKAPEIAAELARVLKRDADAILELITKKRAAVYVARKIDPEVAREIRELSLLSLR